MKVASLREPKMADRVATVLRRMFIRGEIAEGAMLPPASELMEQFGVSRPTLREAFRVLESESLVKIERGVHGGARVTRPRRETLARLAGLILEYDNVTLRDLFDARITIEVPMAVQLAEQANPSTIAQLERIIERESQIVGGGESPHALNDFHTAIARLNGNRTLELMSDMLYHLIEKAHRSLQPMEGARAEQATRRSSKTHQMLLDLIKAGDADGAGELWLQHLKKVEEFVLSRSDMSSVALPSNGPPLIRTRSVR
jgi:DNA-binding FadR family transcriptional regulator